MGTIIICYCPNESTDKQINFIEAIEAAIKNAGATRVTSWSLPERIDQELKLMVDRLKKSIEALNSTLAETETGDVTDNDIPNKDFAAKQVTE